MMRAPHAHLLLLVQVAILATILSTSKIALALSASPAFDTIRQARVLDPRSGDLSSPLHPEPPQAGQKSLVVILPQLGEFDSSEMCEQLVAVQSQLTDANISLRVIGIGDVQSAELFSKFTGLSLDVLRLDPDAVLHQELDLHAGPNWDLPDFVSDDVLTFLLNTLPGGAPSSSPSSSPSNLRSTGRAWFNYLLMCAGIGAPGTLREILRGYFGDQTAPERFTESDTVQAGFITIGPGVGPVKMGPLQYQQWFADERGYQRPVELATIRLKNMVEILTKWEGYVSNPTAIDRRGATYLFDEGGEVLYQYRHRGVLTYSETMARPLSFLAPYLGEEVSANPLGLPDNRGVKSITRGRGILKPAGRFMSLLKPVFASENKLQAKLVFGVAEEEFVKARKSIEGVIASNHVVIYTYGLSPFSTEAIALLEDAGCTTYEKVELGLEWFLLGKEESTIRAELLAMTGQSSLPHVFVGGKHVGGLFSGTEEGGPGIAALMETGELRDMLMDPSS